MALAATYILTKAVTASAALYTVPSASSVPYLRDLILTNSGTVSLFISLGSGSTGALTTSSFQVPAGGSVVLSQCQVPSSAIVFGTAPTGTGSLSVGYGSVVSVI